MEKREGIKRKEMKMKKYILKYACEGESKMTLVRVHIMQI